MDKPSELAMKIAAAITDEYSVGNSSAFCDEVDWDRADEEDIARIVDRILNEWEGKRLS